MMLILPEKLMVEFGRYPSRLTREGKDWSKLHLVGVEAFVPFSVRADKGACIIL